MGRRDLPFATRTVTVSGAGLPEVMGQPALVFSKLSGTERLCELFEYEIELKTPDERNVLFAPAADLDTNALRGQELTVTVALDGSGTGLGGGLGAGTREITGLVTDIHGPIPVAQGRQIKYRLTLRPWLWLATLNRDTRIFQQQTVVEILDTLLANYIFPVERRLVVARYPKREYQVQYNESDFEFFQRLTQEWGISWHIEHSEGKHRLVLTDGNGAFTAFASPAYQTIRWQPAADRIDEEHLHSFELHDRVVSGQWTSNYTIPTAPGVCIDHGFVADGTGGFQEIFSAGIDLPSFPDVSFSLMSNKDASTDGDPGLIERHYGAMGKTLEPGVTRLQLGKREVNGWNGEQVLRAP